MDYYMLKFFNVQICVRFIFKTAKTLSVFSNLLHTYLMHCLTRSRVHHSHLAFHFYHVRSPTIFS